MPFSSLALLPDQPGIEPQFLVVMKLMHLSWNKILLNLE